MNNDVLKRLYVFVSKLICYMLHGIEDPMILIIQLFFDFNVNIFHHEISQIKMTTMFINIIVIKEFCASYIISLLIMLRCNDQ